MCRRAQDRIRMYYYKTKEELLKTKEIALPQKQLQSLILDLHNRLKMNHFHGYYFDRACSGNENMKSICDIWGTFTCQGRWDKEKCLYHPAHSINPYVSREARIIFQTWNLDHNKERTRSIIPAIRSALRACGSACGCGDCTDDGCSRNEKNEKIRQSLNDQNVINGLNVVHKDKVDRNVIDKNVSEVGCNIKNARRNIIPIENLCLDVKGIYDDLFTTNNLKLVHIVCHDKGVHGTRKAGPYLVLN